jgi:hypothetical protein
MKIPKYKNIVVKIGDKRVRPDNIWYSIYDTDHDFLGIVETYMYEDGCGFQSAEFQPILGASQLQDIVCFLEYLNETQK